MRIRTHADHLQLQGLELTETVYVSIITVFASVLLACKVDFVFVCGNESERERGGERGRERERDGRSVFHP